MPAMNSKRLFCGLFLAKSKPIWKLGWSIQGRSDQRKEKKSKKRRMMMNIYVGNLSNDVTDATIKEAFESFGEVTSARVIKDKYSGQSRGFGFVEMPTEAQAQTAIRSLNGKDLLGKSINVSEARASAGRGRTGGQGGRRNYSGRGSRY
jgi:RNA recognition motif-containing protein